MKQETAMPARFLTDWKQWQWLWIALLVLVGASLWIHAVSAYLDVSH